MADVRGLCLGTRYAIALLVLALTGTLSAHAKPTQAQITAVRSACPGDYRAHCATIPPGGPAALACLKKNVESLSAACKTAVSAASGEASPTPVPQAGAPSPAPSSAAPPAAAATAPRVPAAPARAAQRLPPREEFLLVRRSCGPDYRALCGGVRPGGGRLIACLRGNASALSPSCKLAIGHALAR